MHRRALTAVEVLAVAVAAAAVLAIFLPAFGRLRHAVADSGSRIHLRELHEALMCYAADWNDRQFTGVPDDLGVAGGDCWDYADQFGCYPPLYAGLGCNNLMYAWWGDCPALSAASPCSVWWQLRFDPEAPFLVCRTPQLKAIHDYVNGRFHDRVFYSPLDHKAYEAAAPVFDDGCEFSESAGTIPSSYALSPAAMYNPAVFSDPSDTGNYYQSPFDLADGFESPSVSQATYPAQKTRMLEHNWLQNPPAPCNPSFSGCTPYFFNHGIHSIPMTLFFDGHVNGLSPSEAVRSEARVLAQTGGKIPLWSRDTPFGSEGYFCFDSWDIIVTSYHVLTLEGIRGRDTLE